MDDKYNLQHLPPIGDECVADFAFDLFEIARQEKLRLNKPADFMSNYALYRGQQSRQQTGRKGYPKEKAVLTPINLYFSNVERTVAVITARNPVGEVVDMDGVNDGAEGVLSVQLKKWWKDTDQTQKLRQAARMMEIYGMSPEKPYWDKSKDDPDVIVTDPFSFFPSPGYYDSLAEEAPYICYAYLEFVSKIEAEFNVTNIAKDDAYDLLGASREDYKPPAYGGGQHQTIGNYSAPMTIVRPAEGGGSKTTDRCLIIEVWVRDVSCPDGIRKITITKAKSGTQKTKSGMVVLDDSPNPNINPALPQEIARETYPWGRLPVYHVNSYKDLVSIWGFSAAEQVGDLIVKINQIITKLIAYVLNVMAPPLIVQQHCGITREMIESSINKAGRLILMPTVPNARIEFLQVPNLPSSFFEVLDQIVRFFDRIYQIEDADRGVVPSGVVAASAIIALQERNQITMQTKTSAVDYIASQRAKWAIGLWQNFGTAIESVNVGGAMTEFRGCELAGRKFNYVVETGSTTPRTSLQKEETAKWLYQVGAIGRQGLLEALNWENWKEEIERSAEGQLGQALQILIEAGLPQEVAAELQQYLELDQGGPGNVPKPGNRAQSVKTTPEPIQQTQPGG